jgi:hypothetical protein
VAGVRFRHLRQYDRGGAAGRRRLRGALGRRGADAGNGGRNGRPADHLRTGEPGYPFSSLEGDANVYIFPDLNAANVAYKLLARFGGAEAIGPILLRIDRPVQVLQRGSTAADIVNLTAVAVVDAQQRKGGGE